MTIARVIPKRIQDQQDFAATLDGSADGLAIIWDNDTSQFTLAAFLPLSSVSAFMLTLFDDADAATARNTLGLGSTLVLDTDTRADILASAPDDPVLALATDTLEQMLWDGSAWYVAPLELIEQANAVDMGLQPPMVANDRAGYSADYITDKTIYNSAIGGSANSDEGGIRVSDGEAQVYLSGDWQAVVTGFRFREDDNGGYELEHRPIGFDWWIEVLSGNSDKLGLNGLPLAQQYEVSMGAYPVHQQIVGREITA